jgi:hypothetical protein
MITTDYDRLRRGAAPLTLSLEALRPTSAITVGTCLIQHAPQNPSFRAESSKRGIPLRSVRLARRVPHMPILHVGSCFFPGPPIFASAGAPPSLFEGGLLGL